MILTVQHKLEVGAISERSIHFAPVNGHASVIERFKRDCDILTGEVEDVTRQHWFDQGIVQRILRSPQVEIHGSICAGYHRIRQSADLEADQIGCQRIVLHACGHVSVGPLQR